MKIHVCGMSSSTQNDRTVQGHHVHFLVSKHTSTREGSKGNTYLSYAGFKCCTLSLVMTHPHPLPTADVSATPQESPTVTSND